MAYSSSKLEFKVVLLGPSNVGKTAIIRRIRDGTFPDETERTPGPTLFEVKKTISDKNVTLKLWDTAGGDTDTSKSLSEELKKANAVGFVYDITNGKSLRDLDNFVRKVDEHCRQQVVKFVVGNKSDQESRREITYDKLQQFADENDIGMFYEISAKFEHNHLEKTMEIILKELYSNRHKVVVVGQRAVGKTKLVNMLQGSDQPTTPTRVNRAHEIELHAHTALIIDTPGADSAEAQSSVTPVEDYSDADGFVIVFNCSSRQSHTAANYWFEKIRGLKKRNKNMQFMFVANDKETHGQELVDFHEKRVRIEEEHKDTIVKRVKFDDTSGAVQAFQDLFERIKSAKQKGDTKGDEEDASCIIL